MEKNIIAEEEFHLVVKGIKIEMQEIKEGKVKTKPHLKIKNKYNF